jgi:hypothetical protein
MTEKRINKFFPNFVEIMPIEGFVFPVLPVGAKLYYVTLVYHCISISVSVTAESIRAQHSLGCEVSDVF